jgi:hypothetical protein
MESTDFRLIPLSGKRGSGLFAKVDPNDYERVARKKWWLDRDGYAWTWLKAGETKSGKVRPIGMHRFVNETPEGLMTDHINCSKLDNRRANLRTATNSENQANRPALGGSSRFKGVHFRKGAWTAQIKIDRKVKRLGRFSTEVEAAAAYDNAAVAAWGAYARLNFPDC